MGVLPLAFLQLFSQPRAPEIPDMLPDGFVDQAASLPLGCDPIHELDRSLNDGYLQHQRLQVTHDNQDSSELMMGPGQREQFVEIDAVDILKLRYRERPRPRRPGGCRADNRNGEQNNGHRSGDRGFSRQSYCRVRFPGE